MPTYPFQCPKCKTKSEHRISIEEYEKVKDRLLCFNCSVEGFPVFQKRIYLADFLPAVYVPWGNPIRKGGDRKGYHPEFDDSNAEIKADFECLKEKQMHTADTKTHGKLTKTLKQLEYVYRDVLKR